MLVYNEDMSIDAKRQVLGNSVVSISLRNSVVSLRYDGSLFTCGCSHLSTNWDKGSVMLLQLDTIGLITGGLHNSNHAFFYESIAFQ